MKYLSAIFFSLNLSLVLIWEQSQIGSSRLLGEMNRVVPQTSGRFSHFVFLWLVAALLSLAVFTLLVYIPRWEHTLSLIAGLMSIAALPVGCLVLRFLPEYSTTATGLLVFEMLASIGFVCVIWYQKLNLPAVLTAIIFACHFLVWGLVKAEREGMLTHSKLFVYWSDAAYLVTFVAIALPTLGFIANLTWYFRAVELRKS